MRLVARRRMLTNDGITSLGKGAAAGMAGEGSRGGDPSTSPSATSSVNLRRQRSSACGRRCSATSKRAAARSSTAPDAAPLKKISLSDIVGKALDRPMRHQLLRRGPRPRAPAGLCQMRGSAQAPRPTRWTGTAAPDGPGQGLPRARLRSIQELRARPDHALIHQAVERVAAVREDPVEREMEVLINCRGRFSQASRSRSRRSSSPAASVARGAVRFRERPGAAQGRPQHRDAPSDRRALLHEHHLPALRPAARSAC